MSLVDHGLELIRLAAYRGIGLRLLGSAAVAFRCGQVARQAGLEPPAPRDLDFACAGTESVALAGMLKEFGYRQDQGLLIALEGRRWVLTAADDSHCVDVFFDEMEFTHRIDLRGRLSLDPVTLAPADLLLAKLQYIQPAARDMTAVVLLLAAHAVVTGERGGIDRDRIVSVLAASWGFYHTASANLLRAEETAPQVLTGSPTLAERVRTHALALRSAVEATPKPLSWRVRALIGTRIKWYNEVERGEVF